MTASKGTLLIVDDDPHIRLTLGDRLQQQGYEVDTAADGEQGLQRVRTGDPDVVLLDVQMPGLGGLQVLEQLQELERQPTVVMVTAYGSVERAVAAMRAGPSTFSPSPSSGNASTSSSTRRWSASACGGRTPTCAARPATARRT